MEKRKEGKREKKETRGCSDKYGVEGRKKGSTQEKEVEIEKNKGEYKKKNGK